MVGFSSLPFIAEFKTSLLRSEEDSKVGRRFFVFGSKF